MSVMLAQSIRDIVHPLEAVEQVCIQRDITYDQSSDEELIAELKGAWSHYKLWFRWEEDLGLLVFSCALDVQVKKTSRAKLYPLLAELNEKLWLGHFDMTSDDGTIMFRYSMLAHETLDITSEQIEALIDIATTECNRCYPALQSVLWGNTPVNEAVTLALFDTAGEA